MNPWVVLIGGVGYILLAAEASALLARRWRSQDFWMDTLLLALMLPLAIVALIFGLPRIFP